MSLHYVSLEFPRSVFKVLVPYCEQINCRMKSELELVAYKMKSKLLLVLKALDMLFRYVTYKATAAKARQS